MGSQAEGSVLLYQARARRLFDRFDLLCAMALLLSFAAIYHLPFSASKFSDAYFHGEAKALAHAIRGAGPWSDVSFVRAPGPVIYYAVPYLFVQLDAPDDTYWQVALAWNVFWMFISVLLIRRSGELLGSEISGKIAAALCLIIPFGVYYSFGVSGETPAFVATTVFLYGWASWRRRSDSGSSANFLWLSSLGLAGLIFCRPNAVVIIGMATLCGAVLWLRRSPDSGRDLLFAVKCLAIVLVLVASVSLGLRRYSSNHGVSTQASNFADVAFFGSFQFRSEPWDWRFWGKTTRQGSVDYANWVQTRAELADQAVSTNTPISKLELAWVLRDMIRHPLTRLQMFAVRVLALNVWIENSRQASSFGVGHFRGIFIFWLFHLFLNGLALAPLYFSARFLRLHYAQILAYWPLWAPWLGLLIFHALTYSEPRYMLPAQPGLLLLTGCFFAKYSPS